MRPWFNRPGFDQFQFDQPAFITSKFTTALILLALSATMFSGCKSMEIGGKKFGGFRKKDNMLAQEDLAEEALDPLGARNSNRLLWHDLAPSQIGTTFRVRTNMNPQQETAREAFETAKAKFAQGSAQLKNAPNEEGHISAFIDAANGFRIASANAPGSSLDEESLYYEGESYFFADRYVQSNRAFEKLIGRYSGSRFLDDAEQRRYSIALYWLELAKADSAIAISDPKRPRVSLAQEARRILHRIRIDDPTGKLADDATFSLGNAFLDAKRYYEAADSYEDLRRNYPGSKHLFPSHMLELEARLKSYQGPSYDATPLVKAEALVKTIVQQFPAEAQQNIDTLEQQKALVDNQLAQRDFELGRYFENRGENLAAKMQYEAVAQKHSNTVFGETIQEQIASVAEKPPTPKQHAKWLVDMFPNPEADKPVIAAGDNETIFR
jgi:outer membrane protein assembly factor BamD (BamD/ComL family)